MIVEMHESWNNKLHSEFNKKYFVDLLEFIKQEYHTKPIYPPAENIFKAFDSCTFETVKVVIIGQDPYHGKGQANGLCFSVNKGICLPPSLRNIYKELKADLNIDNFHSGGDLSKWADRGVFLLNATLTVQANNAGSHQNIGWEIFTDAVIEKLSTETSDLVFILWGAYAQKKGSIINKSKHFVIESAHPSPFSAYRGFFGSKAFSKTNQYLKSVGKEPIDWSL